MDENQNMNSTNMNNTNGVNPGYNPNMDNGGYNPNMNNGEYNPNMNNAGYNPNMNNGGYNPNMNNGGYNPNMNNGGYNPNMNNGGYNPNMNNGGYNPNMNNGGYNPNTNINIEVDENVLKEWGEFSVEDANANKVMAVLSYLIPIIPFLAEKNSKWVRFHSVQGMNYWVLTLAIVVILTVIITISAFIPFIGWLIALVLGLLLFALSIGSLALTILGIVNVLQFKAKELPLVSKIKIFKK